MNQSRLLLRIILLVILLAEIVVFFSKPKIDFKESRYIVADTEISPEPDAIVKMITAVLPPPQQLKEENAGLPLELLGTAIGNVKDPIAYIKDLETGKQGIYRLGYKVREATIVRITIGEVLLDVNGRAEILRLSKRGRSWAGLGGVSPAIISISGDKVVVSKRGLANELGSIEEAVRKIKVKPFREAQKVTGLMVEGIEENSLAAQAGIRDKDVVTAVNNQKTDSYQKALQVFLKAIRQSQIKVNLLREGQPKSISYQFEK